MNPVDAPITRYLYARASEKRVPISGTFELSPVCNFNCRMCYVRMSAEEVRKHHRPILTLTDWIRIAEEAKRQGTLFLLLTGGEPLLWPDFWELYERLVRMGFLVSINTNGSLIDEAAMEKFRAFPPGRVNITLYGASDDTYESLCQAKHVYEKVKHAIFALKEAGIPVKINCSLTPHNAKDLPEMAAFARENQLILDATPYMYPPVRRDESMVGVNDRFTPEEAARVNLLRIRLTAGEEYYPGALEQILQGSAEPIGLDESCIDPVDGKVRCRAGKAAFWVTWDGYMTPCGMMPEPRVDMSEGFLSAWEKTRANSEGLALSGTCSKCDNHTICKACGAIAVAETGSFSGVPTYLCRMVKEMKRLAALELNAQSFQSPGVS